MVVGAFPIAKLAALAFRQLSKPLANRIKVRAKRSPFFRTYVCMPPAQIYHWIEVNVKMRILNLGKPSDVPKLNEAMAIELGSELLGEIIIFASAAATLIAEYVRQARNERLKEHAKEDRYCCLEHEVEELRFLVEQHEAQIRHLTRISGHRSPPAHPAPQKQRAGSADPVNQGVGSIPGTARSHSLPLGLAHSHATPHTHDGHHGHGEGHAHAHGADHAHGTDHAHGVVSAQSATPAADKPNQGTVERALEEVTSLLGNGKA